MRIENNGSLPAAHTCVHWLLTHGPGMVLLHSGQKKQQRIQKWLMALLLGSSLGSVGTARAQTTGPAANDSLVEVVVTARKRNENLIDTPVAVDFLSGDQLQRAGITDMVGLVEDVPQLHMATFFSGNGMSVSIRGIGSPITDVGVESSVSMVFDGVQTSRGILGQLGMFDVANVQVLKGPQALFFGKNSPAGVIAVNSKGPTDTWQGTATASYEFESVEPAIEAAFGGPITDTLGIRVAMRYDHMDGYIANNAQPATYGNPFFAAGLGAFIPGLPATFSVLGAPSRHTPNNQDLLGRVVLEWKPVDSFSASLHFMAGQLKNDGANAASFETRCESGPHPYELGIQVMTAGCTPNANSSVNQVLPSFVRGQSPYQDFTGTVSSLDLNYNVAKLAFSSTTGLVHFNSHIFDLDDGLLALFDDASNESYRQFSEELRVRSNFDSPLNFMAGMYYEDSNHPFQEEVWYFVGLLPVNPTTGDYNGSFTHSFTDDKTYSPFAQVTWKISDNLQLDVGARYTHEEITNTQYNSVTSPWLPIFGLNPLPIGITLNGSTTFTNTSPEATLSWHPHDETMLYVAYKTGYKSGGYSTPGNLIAPPTATAADFAFRPEKSNGGELGYKGLLLEHTLQITSAIYYYKFKDLQQSEFDSATLSFSTQNAAAATTKGIESDILWRATHDLTLHASINYNHGRFDSFENSPCYAGQVTGCTSAGTQSLSGTRLPYSSDWTELVGFTFDRVLTGQYRFTFGSSAQYLSSVNTSATESSLANYGPIWLLGGNLGIYSPGASGWRAELVGRNLLNEHYIAVSIDRTAATNAFGSSAVTDQYGPINHPREIWLQLTKEFGK
jgi:iron complex outermembrane recepter protein